MALTQRIEDLEEDITNLWSAMTTVLELIHETNESITRLTRVVTAMSESMKSPEPPPAILTYTRHHPARRRTLI